MTTQRQQPGPHSTDAVRQDIPGDTDASHPNHLVATSLSEQPGNANGERAQPFATGHDINLTLQRQARLLNLSFEPIFVWSVEGGIIDWNAGAQELYGYTRAEALGRVSHELLRTVHPIPVATLLTVLDRDGRWAGELRHTTKDGREVLVESRQQAIVMDGQRLILEANRDVTERRRLEQQVYAASREAKERAERLEAIFSAVADGIFVYDADGHIVERNPAAAAMLEAFAPPAMYGASVYERTRRGGGIRDAEGRKLREEAWPQTRIARGEVLGGPTAVDIRVRRRDGQDAYLSVSGAPLRDEEGAIIGSVCLYRDFTERWEMGAALRARTHEMEDVNAQLQTLLQVLPAGVAIVDGEGKPQLVNDALRQIWGETLPMSESTAQYGEYKAWRTDNGQRIAGDEWGLALALTRGETSIGDEYDIEAFDGRRKTILDSAAPLRDQEGTIIGAVSVIFDITARRQLEQRTREALEAFIAITRTLVEVPGDSSEGNTRLDAAETPGGEQPDDRKDISFRSQNENPLARRLAELTRGILGCSRVGINAVEGEQLLSRPVAVVGLTPEQEPQWWEEQAALPPQKVGDGLLPEDTERLLAGDVLTLDLTRPPYQIPNAYGVTSVLAAAMRTQGRIVGMLALDFLEPGEQPHVFTPEEIQIAEAVARLGAVVLERDRLVREREAARAEALALAEANRRMDEFLGIAGHELRTPITTIKANLQMAARRTRQIFDATHPPEAGARTTSGAKTDKSLEQLLRLLERAAQSADRQERLVQDLLDMSRISTDQLGYRMAPLDLAALVRETVEEQRLGNPMRRIELEMPAGPVPISADCDRLAQVLTNYLTNALKYSVSDCPVSVTLSQHGKSARVAVRDQGPGLSAEQQRHLFERFHRVPGIEVVSGSGVGLGLGLYISKTIVEQHGGHVGVQSAPGKGSTFWFDVPQAERA